MPKRVLVLGTRNRKKRDELVELLRLDELEIWTLERFETAPEVVEDGDSFLANATLKAVTLSRALGHWVLGEDSGLAVDALGGTPGIYSARYAGEPTDDERNNDKLLRELESVPEKGRTAHYVCTAVVADPHGEVRATAEGLCDGRIALERHGANGFGYDPLFLVPDRNKTFGELPSDFKRAHSHRAAALERLRPQLLGLLQTDAW